MPGGRAVGLERGGIEGGVRKAGRGGDSEAEMSQKVFDFEAEKGQSLLTINKQKNIRWTECFCRFFLFNRKAFELVRKDHLGQVLLTQRGQHMRTFPKCWVFPGGGVDPAESLACAACRELQEETGLQVALDSLRFLVLLKAIRLALLQKGTLQF